jgi:hypothetical protein
MAPLSFGPGRDAPLRNADRPLVREQSESHAIHERAAAAQAPRRNIKERADRAMRRTADSPEMTQLIAHLGFYNYRIFIGCTAHWLSTMAPSHFGTGPVCGGSLAGTDREASYMTIHAPDGEGYE